ncbi:MAG: rod shape-determining protein RodA, partial [Ruminococcaceae bacterium]|nr:rod shape-determining protein RodA [Oscillospiraceae bacterium]
FIGGLSLKYFAVAGGILAVLAPVSWFFLLQDFQKNRILTFLNPELDPLGSGYHVIQSKIAIGSGGVLGRGIGQGIQTQYSYLPEKQTDFIFAVIGEEMGMWGCILVLTLFLIMIIRCFIVASQARDHFGELLSAGVGFMLIAHVFESLGMCLGLLPVTGIPLPFVSYGGSNMIASLLALALVLNVHMRRKRIQF